MPDEIVSQTVETHVEGIDSTSALERIADIAAYAAEKSGEENQAADLAATQAVAQATIALGLQTAAAAEMEAAAKIAEHSNDVDSIKGDVSWLKTEVESLKTLVQITLSQVQKVEVSPPSPPESLVPEVEQSVIVEPEAVNPPKSADEKPAPKTPAKKKRRLI